MVDTQNPFLLVCQYIINVSRDWLDVRIYVLQQFTNRFRFYENIGVLDPVNEKHLFALLYVYLPLINRTIA